MLALYFLSDPSFHISGSRLVGQQTGQRIFFFSYLLLSQLKAVWDRNHVWFRFPCCRQLCKFPEWMREPRDSLNMHNSLREPPWSVEPESPASMITWFKTLILGGTLVHGIGLCAPNAGGLSLILDQGTRSHKPKLRPGTAKSKNKQNSSANSCALKKNRLILEKQVILTVEKFYVY